MSRSAATPRPPTATANRSYQRQTQRRNIPQQSNSFLASTVDAFFSRPLPSAEPANSHAIPIGVANLVWGTPQPLNVDNDRIMQFRPRNAAPVVIKRQVQRPQSAYAATQKANGLLHVRDVQVSRDLKRTSGLTHAFITAREESHHLNVLNELETDRVLLAMDLSAFKESTAQNQKHMNEIVHSAKEEKEMAVACVKEIAAHKIWHEERGNMLAVQVDTARKESKQVTAALEHLSQDHSNLQRLSAEQVEQISDEKDRVKYLSYHHAFLTKHIEEKMQPVIAELEGEVLKWKNMYGEAIRREQELATVITTQRQKKLAARTESARWKNQTEQARIQVDLLNAELKDERAKLAQQNTKYSHLLSSSESLRLEHTELSIRATHIEEQFVQTQDKLKHLMSLEEERELALKVQLHAEETAHARLKMELATVREQLQKITQEHSECTVREQDHHATILKLEREMATLKSSLAQANTDAAKRYNDLSALYAQSQTQLSLQKLELSHSHSKATELQQERDVLERRIREAEEDAAAEAKEEAEHLRSMQLEANRLKREAKEQAAIAHIPAQFRGLITSTPSRSSAPSPLPSSNPTLLTQQSTPTTTVAHGTPALVAQHSTPTGTGRHVQQQHPSVATPSVPSTSTSSGADALNPSAFVPAGGKSKAFTLRLLLDTAQETIASLQAQITSLNEQGKEYEEKISLLHFSLGAHVSSIACLNSKLDQQKELVEEVRREKAQVVQQNAQAATIADTQLAAVQAQLREMEQKYAATVHLNEEQAYKMRLQAELNKHNLERSDMNAQQRIDEITQEVATLKAEAEKQLSLLQESQASEAALQLRFDELSKSREDLQCTHEAFQASTAAATVAAESRLAEVEARTYNLNIQLRSTQLQVAGLRMRVKQREKQIASLEEKLLTSEATFLKDKAVLQENVHSAKEKLIVTIRQCRSQTDEIRTMQNELYAKRTEIGLLNDQLRFFKLQNPSQTLALAAKYDSHLHNGRASLPTIAHTVAGAGSSPGF